MHTEGNVDEVIKDYILREFMSDDPEKVLDDEEALIQGGVIDSLGIFLLINFIEKQFSIKIEPEDIVVENFETIDSIKNLIIDRLS